MVNVVGKDPKVFKQVVCPMCASILEYTPSEVNKYNGKDHTGGSSGYEYIHCPECSNEVILKLW